MSFRNKLRLYGNLFSLLVSQTYFRAYNWSRCYDGATVLAGQIIRNFYRRYRFSYISHTEYQLCGPVLNGNALQPAHTISGVMTSLAHLVLDMILYQVNQLGSLTSLISPPRYHR